MYQLTQGDCILRLSDNAWIPQDPENTDFAAYRAWLAAGNRPQPAPEPPAPVALTPAQRLERAGLTVADLRALLAS
jgi:hypothetical protein